MGRARLRVTVAYARPEHQWLEAVELPAGATARDAVEASGLFPRLPDAAGAGVGGRRVGWDHPVRDGDRVDVCRPLEEGPRERRRRMAREERAGG